MVSLCAVSAWYLLGLQQTNPGGQPTTGTGVPLHLCRLVHRYLMLLQVISEEKKHTYAQFKYMYCRFNSILR
jgi:hypothetical protein